MKVFMPLGSSFVAMNEGMVIYLKQKNEPVSQLATDTLVDKNEYSLRFGVSNLLVCVPPEEIQKSPHTIHHFFIHFKSQLSFSIP